MMKTIRPFIDCLFAIVKGKHYEKKNFYIYGIFPGFLNYANFSP